MDIFRRRNEEELGNEKLLIICVLMLLMLWMGSWGVLILMMVYLFVFTLVFECPALLISALRLDQLRFCCPYTSGKFYPKIMFGNGIVP